MVARASCIDHGSSLSRPHSQNSSERVYTIGFESHGIRKNRVNPNGPKGQSSSSSSRNNHGGNSKDQNNSNTNHSNNNNNKKNNNNNNNQKNSSGTGTRRRIPIACGRCRKRKIKCSGDSGNGKPCLGCKTAGADTCEFLRVQSQRTTLKSDLVSSLDFDSISNARNTINIGCSSNINSGGYGIPNTLPLDAYSYRNHHVAPSCHMRTMQVYDMNGPSYDFSDQNLDYNMHGASVGNYTGLPLDQFQSTNYAQSGSRNLNLTTPQFARTPLTFPELNTSGATGGTSATYSNHNIVGYPGSRYILDNRGLSFHGIQNLSPSFTSPPPPPPSLASTSSIGSDSARHLPIPFANRLPSNYNNYNSSSNSGNSSSSSSSSSNSSSSSISSNSSVVSSGYQSEPDYSYQNSYRGVNFIENLENCGSLSHGYLGSNSNNSESLSSVTSSPLSSSQSMTYHHHHAQNLSMGHQSNDNYNSQSPNTIAIYSDLSETVYDPRLSSGSETPKNDLNHQQQNPSNRSISSLNGNSNGGTCLNHHHNDNHFQSHQAYLPIADIDIEKYSPPPMGISNLTQSPTGYPTPVSISNTFSPPT